ESTAMQYTDVTLATLNRLKALGVSIAIDDFGTGYSSLSYLKRFPVYLLKIDRSFTNELPADADQCAIVSAIVALAHALELRVIAEGVESEAQRLDLDRAHVRVHLEGAAKPVERLPLLLELQADQPRHRERAEVARVALDDLGTVGERAL